jgi:hypothetical protein
MRARPPGLAPGLVLCLLAACETSPPPEGWQPREQEAHPNAFAPGRAWAHLEALAAIGPRSVGTEGNERARAYLVDQLERLRLEVVQQRVEVRVGDAEPFDLVNVAARIPGSSQDAIVLATGYDTTRVDSFPYLGVNEAASGPAVLLEMARVIADDPLPYTTWVVFLDGEAPAAPGDPPRHFGSKALADRLSSEGVLDQLRLAVVIEKVCDPDLRIARDLRSQRIYREEFWRTAARLGHAEAFPRSSYESLDSSHRPLAEAGLRRVVVLSDSSFGGGDPPGVFAGTVDDDLAHCSAESLGIVATVSLAALDVISARLAKIDRFSKSPVAEAQALAWDTLERPEPESEELPPAEAATTESPAVALDPAPSAPAADPPAGSEPPDRSPAQ